MSSSALLTVTWQNMEWKNCLGVCTDGAQSMAGKKKGLRALIMRVLPKAHWTQCFIHREALAARQIPEPWTERCFDYQRGQFHQDKTSESATVLCTMQRDGSATCVFSQVFELREEICIFLEEERSQIKRWTISDETSLSKWHIWKAERCKSPTSRQR